MRNSLFLLMVLYLAGLVTQTAVAQVSGGILAGVSVSGDSAYSIVYHDPADTTIRVRYMGGSNIEEHFFVFDLDGDGTNDYSFRLTDHAVHGTGDVFSGLEPLNGNLVAVDEEDTTSYCTQKNAARFNAGDSIGAHTLWHNKEAILDYSYWFPSYGGNCGIWRNQVDKYAGLGITAKADTLFGWIRISVQRIDIYLTLTVKDFALKFRTPSGMPMATREMVEVFPNPTEGVFRLKTGMSWKHAKIFKPDGRLVQIVELDGPETVIDLSAQLPGVYCLAVDCDAGRVIRKIIIL